MVRKYDLICKSCNKYIWLGQDWPEPKEQQAYIYKGKGQLQLLETFLFEHQGHDLIFIGSKEVKF